jgi:hypothetical protein
MSALLPAAKFAGRAGAGLAQDETSGKMHVVSRSHLQMHVITAPGCFTSPGHFIFNNG